MSYVKTLIIAVIIAVFLSGCQTLGVGVQGPGHSSAPPPKYEKHGPPPHAPAHGYRYKNRDGRELKYDSNLGAYIVLNIPDTYFGNGYYIRMSSDGRWLVSTTLEGGWRVAVGSEIPPKLFAYKHGEKQYKNKKEKKNKKNKKHKWDNDQGEDDD